MHQYTIISRRDGMHTRLAAYAPRLAHLKTMLRTALD